MCFQIEIKLKDSQIDICKQVADAEAFTMRFAAGACARSTPHIYISGLPFCPRDSLMHENYWRHTRADKCERECDGAMAKFRNMGGRSEVFSVAFSPDGVRIVSGSVDKTIRLWDARTGDTVAGPFKGHTDSVSFSPDGMHIVSGSGDHTIRVWDAHTGDTVTRPFKGHTNSVRSVAFSLDGTSIVSGSIDQTIRIWDARTGNTVAGPFIGHKFSLVGLLMACTLSLVLVIKPSKYGQHCFWTIHF